MTYYIGEIHERNGDYEYIHTFKFSTNKKPARFLTDLAKCWYGSKPDKDEGGYFFNAGAVFVCAGDSEEISKETFNTIPLLSNMTGNDNL